MHQEAVPAEAVPHPQAASPRQDPPKGLLQQMEELMAALDADLSRLDADLQSSTERPAPTHDSRNAPEPQDPHGSPTSPDSRDSRTPGEDAAEH
ncbi:hypothetical protein ACSNOK_10405 [Streptomyces sp. URMC 126]|uniref:hypothetical protein n=1 Tax=Streptomyces sp. URMC 126 TaxID=3423401 RepID=UPI003F1C4C10